MTTDPGIDRLIGSKIEPIGSNAEECYLKIDLTLNCSILVGLQTAHTIGGHRLPVLALITLMCKNVSSDSDSIIS